MLWGAGTMVVVGKTGVIPTELTGLLSPFTRLQNVHQTGPPREAYVKAYVHDGYNALNRTPDNRRQTGGKPRQ